MPEMLNEEQLGELDKILAEEAAAAQSQGEATDAEALAEAETEAPAEGAEEEAATLSAEDAAAAQEAGAQEAAQQTAAALPEGIGSIEELAAKYEELTRDRDTRAQDMQALRDLNAQLVSIAEALGYTRDVGSVDLNVDERLKESDPDAYARGQIRKEVADQLKPMLEAQQKNLRGRMIDQAWKSFAQEHADVGDLMDDIRAVLGETPELSDHEDGLSVAYTMAKARKYRPEKELLEDDDFVERAAENPKIKDRVIEKYLREVAKSGEGAPASVGGGGRPTPTAKKKPMTMAEAKKGFLKLLGE